MTAPLVLAFCATLVLDVAGQLAFKHGLETSGSGQLWRRVVTNRATLAGVAAYAVELVLWLVVLSQADLSVAFPAAALAYGGVLLGSRILLGERVSPRRWLGAAVISMGVALVCLSA